MIKVVNNFMNEVCKVDARVRVACNSTEVKTIIKDNLIRDFSFIADIRPDLLEDIQRRTLNFQKLNDPEVRVDDFMRIINWFAMEVEGKSREEDYFNPNGKYYGLRMNEVINMYLMARDIEC